MCADWMTPFCAPYELRSKLVITASGVWRGPKTLVLKGIVDGGITLSEKAGHKVSSHQQKSMHARPALWRGFDRVLHVHSSVS